MISEYVGMSIHLPLGKICCTCRAGNIIILMQHQLHQQCYCAVYGKKSSDMLLHILSLAYSLLMDYNITYIMQKVLTCIQNYRLFAAMQSHTFTIGMVSLIILIMLHAYMAVYR